MFPISQRLFIVTGLALLIVGLGALYLARDPGPPASEGPVPRTPISAPEPVKPSADRPSLPAFPDALSPEAKNGNRRAQAGLQLESVAGQREMKDRYAGKPVLEQKEQVQTVAGVVQVRRTRLIQDASFKYAVIRVEDELIRGQTGDRLIRQVAMVGDHVLVKPVRKDQDETELLRLLQGEGATLRRKMPASGTLLIAFANPKLDTVPQMVSRLSGLKDLVKYAEPDFIVQTQATPNDPAFSSLWGLHNTGQSGGVADADIDAPEAWNIHTGSATVKVAVLDTGMDLTHPDLEPNLWTNPNEIAGNGIDDDQNGYIDDVHGWDFVNNDAIAADDHNDGTSRGHGTHCAGTIGAVGNNAVGVVGVCWQVSLIPLKILDANSHGPLSDAEEALTYAANLGVDVASNSWTNTSYTQALQEAMNATEAAGMLVVAAAGNSAKYTEFYPEYPASFDNANIISVAATNRQDALWADSNYGSVSVDLAAPGVDIHSTLPGGTYGLMTGTSMACPHVAGACALVKSYRPSLTAAEIRNLILKSADELPALADKTVTGGRLNVLAALRAANDLLVTPGTGLIASGAQGGPFTPTGKAYSVTNYSGQSITWRAATDQPWLTLTPASGSLPAGHSVNVQVTVNSAAGSTLPGGTHVAEVSVTNESSGRVQARSVAVQVNAVPVYQFDLETDPGWPRTGEWAYGVPQGGGATVGGRKDPTAGATGSHVLGINLAGDYSTSVGQAQYLTAGPFDLTNYRNLKLRYQRWLNTDSTPYVYAQVQVSWDGSTWQSIMNNDSKSFADAAWTQMEHSLPAGAEGQSQVYVRWMHWVAQTGGYARSGWNLDDIQIIGSPQQQMTLTLPDSVTEGEAAQQALLSISPAPPTNLTVTLTSSRPGAELTLPATVTIPAGATEAAFQISAIDDALADGTQTVTITASATGYPTASGSVKVHDNESESLTLVLPASVQEGSGTLANVASLRLNAPAAADITVSLTSSNPGKLAVPASLVLPKGLTSVALPLTVPDDNLIDGTQTVTITASVSHWPAAEGVLSVTDNEARILTVSLPDRRLESAGVIPRAGLVQASGTLAQPLVVSLASSDTSELIVPASVTIPAGSSSVTFSLEFPDDEEEDGEQEVTVTASSPGFTSGSDTMKVADNESPALPYLPSPASGQNPAPPNTSLSWQYDPNSGSRPDSYQIYFDTKPSPTVSLGITANRTVPLSQLNPETTYYWRVVSRKGSITRQGPVWSFVTPEVGPVHHFIWLWDPAPTVVGAGVPFPVRIQAVDEYGVRLSQYGKRTPLIAVQEFPETTTDTGSYSWTFPLASYSHDARTQCIYLPTEVGPEGKLTALALELVSPPGQTLNAFTLRLKHTSRTGYPAGQRTWESGGWTTVYSGNVTLSGSGWKSFTFTTPFDYDGSSNLMVDFSFNNSSYSTDGVTLATLSGPEDRTLAFQADSTHGDPASWSGTLPEGTAYEALPNLRFRRASRELTVEPDTSGDYTQGSWAGQVSLPHPGTTLRLKVTDPDDETILGLSSPLQVISLEDFQLDPEVPFTGGSTNKVSGPSLGTGYEYEFQRALQQDFGDAASSGYVTSPEHVFTGLQDGLLYHYRARSRTGGALGRWSPIERSTQDATPPAITFSLGSGGMTSRSQMNLSGTGTDISGIASLKVNETASTSSDAHANWSTPALPLEEGLNSFTVVATDKAVPPNVKEVVWTITRLSQPAEDSNANGMPSLLEYAFNSSGAADGKGLPVLSIVKHPDTQKPHLLLRYRRLIINPSELVYAVETSPDMIAWTPLTTSAETVSVSETGDGLTELVQIRLNPSIDLQQRRFARLRIETSPTAP